MMTGCGGWFFFAIVSQKTNDSFIVVLWFPFLIFIIFIVRSSFLPFLSLDLRNLNSSQSILYREWRERYNSYGGRDTTVMEGDTQEMKEDDICYTADLVFEVRTGSCLQ